MITRFRDRHKGERCAILANGESVRDFDPKRWRSSLHWQYAPFHQWSPIIGLNRSWEICDAPYHCIIDCNQLMWAKDHGVSFRHLFIGANNGKDGKYKPDIEARKLVLLEGIKAKTKTILHGQESRYGLGFCAALETATFYIPSVPYMALQIAAWMGVAEIHLWGLDLKGSKFWKADWEIGQPTAQLQNRQFKIANRALKNLGVRVVNHSRGTHCSAFERAKEDKCLA